MSHPPAPGADRAPAPGPIRFDGEVAVVTGAGRGLGRAYAVGLAARGAAVVCNDVDARAAAETAARITAEGGAAVAEASTVATPSGGAAVVEAALDAFGSIEIVVNNAGRLRNAAFEDLTTDDVEEVVRTHLGGAFHVTQPAYVHMKRAGYGRIVFTSSSAGLFGAVWQANYAAAKAGVVGLCNAVALEGAPHGIKANVVMPMALTGIGDAGGAAFPPEELRATVRALAALAPHMTPENVAPVVWYLASRRCAPTRQVFSVGCGRFARVFVGEAQGWCAPGAGGLTPELVEANLGAACDLVGHAVPESMLDECRLVAECLDARA